MPRPPVSSLAEADVVVAALGYRPHALPLARRGRATRIALAAHAPGRPRLADQLCRVTRRGQRRRSPAPMASALPPASSPEGRLGGEKSFKGKANGLWQWQNDVGQLIVDQLLGEAVSLAA